MSRRPESIGRWPQRALIGVVRAYRLLLKPWLGGACRFEPTCSHYALTALQRHGALAGSRLTLWRLARCHPLCAGGCDPVPDRVAPFGAGLFTRLAGGRRDAGRHAAGASSPRTAEADAGDIPVVR